MMLYGKTFSQVAFRLGLAALLLGLCLLIPHQGTLAAPTTPAQAKAVAGNWLALNNYTPLEESLDQRSVDSVSTYAADGQALYYLVHLRQAGGQKGFVVVPADDLVEPIVGIFPEAVEYSPSLDNPVGALVHQDLQGRMARARAQTRGEERTDAASSKATAKWQYLLTLDDNAHARDTEKGVDVVGDVRVTPLVQTTWNQSTACGQDTYNIYTPKNYVCGCVATAMAQLLRFHNHPTAGVGTGSFEIRVDGVTESRNLLGGDGSGGAYAWRNMPCSPDCETTTAQRQAISRLTHDAGLTVNMSYAPGGSSTDTLRTAIAFRTTFGYSNAIYHFDWGSNIDSANLYKMLNANLNADLPVVLGITGAGGHAIVCDGYGYDTSTPYHHLNMGWGGSQDAWYNLPTIDTAWYNFNSVYKVIYNVFPNGTGEIISGRVLNQSGSPVSGATVTATVAGSGSFSDTTDSRGVFGLRNVPSNSSATLSASKAGYTFSSRNVTTGTSNDTYSGGSETIGNTWQSDITGSVGAKSTFLPALPLLLDSQ